MDFSKSFVVRQFHACTILITLQNEKWIKGLGCSSVVAGPGFDLQHHQRNHKAGVFSSWGLTTMSFPLPVILQLRLSNFLPSSSGDCSRGPGLGLREWCGVGYLEIYAPPNRVPGLPCNRQQKHTDWRKQLHILVFCFSSLFKNWLHRQVGFTLADSHLHRTCVPGFHTLKAPLPPSLYRVSHCWVVSVCIFSSYVSPYSPPLHSQPFLLFNYSLPSPRHLL